MNQPTTDKKLYCFWFEHSMSLNRKRCYRSMLKNCKVELILITEKNIKNFEVEGHAFHPEFYNLSGYHKADYLRAYFMYYYGGGYSDIKNIEFDWNPYFDMLDESDKMAIGYREKRPEDINYPEAKIIYEQIIGTGAFIHKKGSKIAKDWLDQAEKRLDNKHPLRYTEIGGDIWHKVQVENLGNWLFDLPYIDMNNYR